MRRAIVSLLMLASSAGCTGCRAGEDVYAVFADDDTLAFLVREWREEPSLLWPDRTYTGHRVERADALGDEAEAIVARDGDAVAWTFFAMHRAGYFVLARVVPGGLPVVEQVLEDGTVREVPSGAPDRAEECPALTVIPSPDGALLARVRTELRGCTSHASTSTTVVSAAFLDATTLAPRGRAWTYEARQSPALTWRPGGGFLAVTTECAPPCTLPCQRALLLDPELAPREVDPPGCTSPPTTSSPYASTGMHVTVDQDGRATADYVAAENAFGCQTRPSAIHACGAR